MSLSDEDIMSSIGEVSFSMSDYQKQNFIVKSQITDFRQVKQILLELSGRYDNLRQSEIENEKRKIERDRKKNQLKTCEDPFDKKILEIEIRELEKDIKAVDRRRVTQEKEYEFFANAIKERFNSKEEIVKFLNNPEEERKYWIARLGKQAAMDILSTGRIGSGNMDSIAMMEEEDQIKVLSVAVQYSGLMSVGIQKLQTQFQPYLTELTKSSDKIIPTFDKIEDNLNVKLIGELKDDKKIAEGFQFTDKPQD